MLINSDVTAAVPKHPTSWSHNEKKVMGLTPAKGLSGWSLHILPVLFVNSMSFLLVH